jgi:hypothetical protein
LNCRPSEPHLALKKGGGRLPPFLLQYYSLTSLRVNIIITISILHRNVKELFTCYWVYFFK